MKVLFIALSFFISMNVFSQNIINTLGSGGLFTIKDGSNNFLTLNQSTGQLNLLRSLRLENTTSSSSGVLFKGTDRFLHDYGLENTFLGINSGNFTLTTANNNTGIGYNSLFSLTTGDYNTALGFQTLYSNTSGFHNVAIGMTSLYSNTIGSQNIALGSSSLRFNTAGNYNTAIGVFSLYDNTSGDSNTALGHRSLYFNTSGHNNTAIGISSLSSNIDGYDNTAVGELSLNSNTTGFNNTAIGDDAGSSITTGHNVTCLGNNAEPTSGTAINQITLGNGGVTSLRCNVQTITSLSDSRDKKNIKYLSVGLDFLMKVKPRLFNWDKREWYENNISDGSKMNEAPTAGFIAQELDEVQTTENAEWLNLVLKDNPEKFEATYGNLLPVMVKAIQDLKVESEKLKVENDKLKVVYMKSTKENIELKNYCKYMNEKFLKLEQAQNKLVSELEKLKLNEIKITEVKTGEQK